MYNNKGIIIYNFRRYFDPINERDHGGSWRDSPGLIYVSSSYMKISFKYKYRFGCCLLICIVIFLVYFSYVEGYESRVDKSFQTNNSIVCLFAYYEKNDEYKKNLQYFLNHGIMDNIDYYFIINGECTVEIPTDLPNIRVVRRKNQGFDFGAWQYVIKKYLTYDYDYYIFVNSSVRGPYMDNRPPGSWLDPFLALFETGKDVKLVGTSINVFTPESTRYDHPPPYSHVQSFFFVLNQEGFHFLLNKGFFNDESQLNQETDIQNIVEQKEIKMSYLILQNGWNINCLLDKYRDKDYRNIRANMNPSGQDPWYPGAYFGTSITPKDTIFYKGYRMEDSASGGDGAP